MKKLFCVGKNRNRLNQIVSYEVNDTQGNRFVYEKAELKKLLKNKNYNFMNLQLDAIGRIIDKRMSDVDSLEGLFEIGLDWIKSNGMVWFFKDTNGKVVMTEPFNDFDTSKVDIDDFGKKFEQYIKAKHNVKLTKLRVENKVNGSIYIQYGLPYVEYTMFASKNYFKGFESEDNLKVTCTYDTSKQTRFKKVATVRDRQTGRVVENALLAVCIVDKSNKDAVEWAKEQFEDIDKAIEKIVVKKK